MPDTQPAPESQPDRIARYRAIHPSCVIRAACGHERVCTPWAGRVSCDEQRRACNACREAA